MDKTLFRQELENLINKNNKENESNTPDFILADFLIDCLTSFDKAINKRTKWYDFKEMEE